MYSSLNHFSWRARRRAGSVFINVELCVSHHKLSQRVFFFFLVTIETCLRHRFFKVERKTVLSLNHIAQMIINSSIILLQGIIFLSLASQLWFIAV